MPVKPADVRRGGWEVELGQDANGGSGLYAFEDCEGGLSFPPGLQVSVLTQHPREICTH